MFQRIKDWWTGRKKYEKPQLYGIIKMNDVAKERGLFEDENKIIEIHDGNDITVLKYTPEETEILMRKGIPLLPEDYTDEYKFVTAEDEGGFDYWRR